MKAFHIEDLEARVRFYLKCLYDVRSLNTQLSLCHVVKNSKVDFETKIYPMSLNPQFT